MKYLFFLILVVIPVCLYAQNEWDELSYTGDYPLFDLENDPPSFYPFALSGQYVDVHKTTFRTPGLEGRKLKYRQWNAAFAYTHPFSQYCGLIFGAGWVGTEVDMQDNPEFSETFFNYVNFSFGGFTKAFDDWTWTLTLATFLDVEEFSFADYTLYQGVLWGKYDFCEWLELDVGLILELGLHKEKIWPIIGFSYLPWRNWRINAVYPINVSIEYEWSPCWTLAGSVRFLRNRHRVQKEEMNSQGIFEYRTSGAELDLIFSPFRWVSVKGFAGHAFDGDLKITDRNNHNATHYKFKGSFYAGASAVLSF
jgi:hypothetical protein